MADDRTGEEIAQLRAEVERLRGEVEAGRAEVQKAKGLTARTMAMFQQRALQMEIIRQQNEDLDRLATELSRAKRAEEERAKELEAASRLKSDFLANFSHEIRTPLNGILGYCELLSREEGSRLTPHGRRDLQVIKNNAKTLLALINDILDLSKIESGHIEVVRERVDLTKLADECLATVREYLRGKTVELTSHVDPTAAVLQTDGLKLRQILLNLLSNAAKFTDTGEIVLDVRRSGDEVQITVEDTGAGIPADKLAFIFEKFRQVDGSMTRKVGGTGLGLAIVRELSRVLGGGVTVESEIGRGTRFTVKLRGVLDESAASGQAMASEHPPASMGTAGKVLVVDDDPLIVHLLRGALEHEGFSVLTASDGLEALRVATEQRPALVVLDVRLPSLDGWTVMARLKADPSLAGIPVVLISVEEQRARALSLGALDFLVKPFEADQLLKLVHGHVTAAGGEVLVVDDDPDTRQLVSRHLRKAGLAAIEARDGLEALALARKSRPSLVILDLAMPNCDGFEVLQAMRAEGALTPVVVLTGLKLSTEEERVLREGIAALVRKGEGAPGRDAVEAVIAEARRVMASGTTAAHATRRKVLYVEDSEQNRDVVRRYLKGLYDLSEAHDGEQGIEAARSAKPELILMDLSLPRIDGYEATRRIKADPALKAVPIVVLTAHASREDERKAREAGCDAFLTKPVERETLIATIGRFFSSERS